MKILITGSTGLLGQALVRRLLPSCSVVGISRHAPSGVGAAQHRVCDLTDTAALERVMRQVQPDVVMHTQALSDVDRCELAPAQAELMNAQAVASLCQACREPQPLLMALSTDYVFDGSKGSPYTEADEPRPVSVYGKSKLAGERIALGYPRAVVIRPSSLFGPGRMNFCDAVVERCRSGRPVEAFVDQATSPTYTEDLADALERLMQVLVARSLKDLPRIYHLTNAGGCSRVQFARQVMAWLGCSEAILRPIQMREQHRPAPRPPYSVLTSLHASTVLGSTLRPWHEALTAYLTRQGWFPHLSGPPEAGPRGNTG